MFTPALPNVPLATTPPIVSALNSPIFIEEEGAMERARNEWLAAVKQKHRGGSTNTIKKYRIVAHRFTTFLQERGYPLTTRSLERRIVWEFADWLEGHGCSLNTLIDYQRVLKIWAKWLARDRHWKYSPLVDLDLPKVEPVEIRTFEARSLQKLLEAAQRSQTPLRDRAIILFLFDSTARISEACSVAISALETKENRVRVVGKGRKPRYLFFSDETLVALVDYIRRERPQESADALFLTHPRRRPMSPDNVRKALKELAAAAHVKERVNPHKFRHSGLTEMIRAGLPLSQVQRIAGHASPLMTMRYEHLAAVDLAKAHAVGSPVARMMGK